MSQADALRAIEAGDTRALEALARLEPDALTGLHHRMLDAGLLRPAIAFRTAGPATRARLLARIARFDRGIPDQSLELNHLLVALAWTGDAQTFARWRTTPPTWANALFIPAHEYTLTAGWTLDANGARRDLYLSTGMKLVRAEQPSGPVRVLTPGAGSCRFCSNPLGTLFELDASELPWIPLEGTFAIPFCHLCSAYGTISFKIDRDGRGTWHEGNKPFRVYDDTFSPWDEGPFALGRALANPFEYAGWISDDVARVGGYPYWIQDDTYPACLDCGQHMTFVAHLDVSSGGRFYGLACFACRTAAAVYQQT